MNDAAGLRAVDILGVPISRVDMQSALEIIGNWIGRSAPRFVTAVDVHGVMRAQTSATHMSDLKSADMLTPDGSPLVWVARARGCRELRRVAGPDLMPALCKRSVEMGWRHYFVGGAEGVAGELSLRLQQRFPGLQVAGVESPPFRALTQAEMQESARKINASGADIVWVGLGCPKQERWITETKPNINKAVMIAVGAAFDFHSGRIARAPRWMQRSGLEWLHRLWSEPGRLWRRYLIMAPAFAIKATWESLILKLGTQKAEPNVKVLALVQLPPPIHGVTAVSARVLQDIASFPDIWVRHLWMGGAKDLRDVGKKRAGKYVEFARLLAKVGISRLRGRYDIAYCAIAPHGDALLRDAILIFAAKICARRVIVHQHTRGLQEVLDGRAKAQRIVRRLISGTELIALSKSARAEAVSTACFNRVHLLRNAVPDPGERSIETGHRLRCSYLGNFDERKGVLRFVDSVAAMRAAAIPAEGVIMGGSSRHLNVNDVWEYVQTKSLSKCIKVCGFCHEEAKSAMLESTDLFVYLTEHDLAPLVLLESMAHGAVPIVFDTGALREMVGPEFADNVISEKGDADKYLERITFLAQRYWDDPKLLLAARKAARRRYLEKFSESAFRAGLAEIFGVPNAGAEGLSSTAHLVRI